MTIVLATDVSMGTILIQDALQCSRGRLETPQHRCYDTRGLFLQLRPDRVFEVVTAGFEVLDGEVE